MFEEAIKYYLITLNAGIEIQQLPARIFSLSNYQSKSFNCLPSKPTEETN